MSEQLPAPPQLSPLHDPVVRRIQTAQGHVDVPIGPKPQPQAAHVANKLPRGLDALKEIFETDLQRMIARQRRESDHGELGKEQVEKLRAIGATLCDIAEEERKRRRADKYGDLLANKTEAELWAIINAGRANAS
jgi:hypothetical protein